MPSVLVLMATLNGERWLDEQLASIFVSDGLSVSLVVSDHGSRDSTLRMLHQWGLQGAKVSVLPPCSTGQGAAGNFLRLLREAPLEGFDCVALSDQDDIWLPGRLHKALQILRTSGAAGYSSNALAFWPDGRERLLDKAHPQSPFDHLFEPAGPGCTYVLAPAFLRAAQAELAAHPEKIVGVGYHDWWLYAFARTNGFTWYIDPEPTVRYRQHASNELGANFGLKGIRKRLGRLTNGWYRGQVLKMGEAWPGPHDELTGRLRRLNWRDRWWLASRARQLRRRPREQVALALLLISGVLR